MRELYDKLKNVTESGIKSRLGKCYQLSYQFVSNNRDWTLVHGYITDRIKTGRTIDHAWAEKGDEVCDPVIDKKFPKSLYYALYGAEPDKQYTSEEATDNAISSKHYGPWHTVDQSKIKFP